MLPAANCVFVYTCDPAEPQQTGAFSEFYQMAPAHPEPRPEFEPLPVPLAPEAWMEKALPGAREEGAPLGWPSSFSGPITAQFHG